MHHDIIAYNKKSPLRVKVLFNRLARTIDAGLPKAESKIWHGSPVWFLDGNPIVGYSKLKDFVSLMFWSGQSFDEPKLIPKGSAKFKAAEARYTSLEEMNVREIRRWLRQAKTIQWDYKNIVKRRGKLIRLRST